MGKPMGNGMPIAGGPARAELLAEFGQKIRILKIRPPLPFSYRHVDQFADALRGSLASPAAHK